MKEQGQLELIGEAVAHHQAFRGLVGCMVFAELRWLDAAGLYQHAAAPSQERIENENHYRMRHHGPEHFVACHAANSFDLPKAEPLYSFVLKSESIEGQS
jgi:hypothetical protein